MTLLKVIVLSRFLGKFKKLKNTQLVCLTSFTVFSGDIKKKKKKKKL